MKFKNVFLAVAFVFAIGLSFATERSTANAQYDYVDIGLPERMKIEEVNCGTPTDVCKGRFEVDGTLYEIYDGPESSTPKIGAGELAELLIPVLD